VVFSKPAGAGTAITLGGSVTIIADPPIGSSNPPHVTPPTVPPSTLGAPGPSPAPSSVLGAAGSSPAQTAATHGVSPYSALSGLISANTDRTFTTPNGDITIKAGSLAYITTRDGT